jgi:DNA-binding transcriptional ArsR family regulator
MSVQEASSRPTRRHASSDLDRSAELLKTLAHACRLRMVQMLLEGRYTVGELAAACKIPSHQASEHLRLMQRCGLLTRRVDGRKVYYDIAQPGLRPIMAFVESHTSRRKR